MGLASGGAPGRLLSATKPPLAAPAEPLPRYPLAPLALTPAVLQRLTLYNNV